ncbi:MAG: hypothetical protein RL380_1633, partial [Verrucomicrobiota bacterium]
MKNTRTSRRLGALHLAFVAAFALALGQPANARPASTDKPMARVAATKFTAAPAAAHPAQLEAPAAPVIAIAAVTAPEPAPAPAPAAPAAPTVNDEMAGKIVKSFRADNLDLKSALALFASQNNLNIVPDNDITGTVTLDVHDLPLEQMMRALLEAGDCSWVDEGGLIRVRNNATRTFIVDYLRLKRSGIGNSSATLSSATGGSLSGSSGGGGSSISSSGNVSSSAITLTSDSSTDFWMELRAELSALLTEGGRNSLAINRTAGIIEITDRPSVLKKIEHYLEATDGIVNRQVDIEVKIYDVELNNDFQFGIDWVHVAEAYGGSFAFGTATLPVVRAGLGSIQQSSLSGLLGGSNGFGGGLSTLVFSNFNTQAAINALKTQGNLEVLAKPRIRTL